MCLEVFAAVSRIITPALEEFTPPVTDATRAVMVQPLEPVIGKEMYWHTSVVLDCDTSRPPAVRV